MCPVHAQTRKRHEIEVICDFKRQIYSVKRKGALRDDTRTAKPYLDYGLLCVSTAPCHIGKT